MTAANIQENGKTIICMALVNTGGRMADTTKECTSMTKSMALEFTSGRMVDSMRVIGSKESSMAKANTFKKMGHLK